MKHSEGFLQVGMFQTLNPRNTLGETLLDSSIGILDGLYLNVYKLFLFQ